MKRTGQKSVRRYRRQSLLPFLFVYGTLRRGRPLHGELRRAGADFAGAASVRGRLADAGGFPGASLDGAETIAGELYYLPAPRQAFRRLDVVEGLQFRRALTRVETARGWKRSWIYVRRK